MWKETPFRNLPSLEEWPIKKKQLNTYLQCVLLSIHLYGLIHKLHANGVKAVVIEVVRDESAHQTGLPHSPISQYHNLQKSTFSRTPAEVIIIVYHYGKIHIIVRKFNLFDSSLGTCLIRWLIFQQNNFDWDWLISQKFVAIVLYR